MDIKGPSEFAGKFDGDIILSAAQPSETLFLGARDSVTPITAGPTTLEG